VVDYGLHMAVTWWGEETAAEMRRCVELGVPSFKTYLAYKDTVGLEDRDLVRVFAAAAELDALVLVHAEHGDVVEHLRDRLAAAGELGPAAHPRSRPPEVEGEATARAAMMAAVTGASLYVVHVTCRPAVEAIRAAQSARHRVAGETCPQYLLLDVNAYDAPDFEGAAYVLAPPLRAALHQQVLWQALRDGTLEIVATDHCPFDLAGQKEIGRTDFRRIPGGAAGVEHRLGLLWTFGVGAGRLDERRFVELVSAAPARRFGLYPRKGTIREGSDADLVVWDPQATATISARTHRHRCDCSIYEGFELVGAPTTVVAAGEVRFEDGELAVERGAGRFLERRLDG
jgi:dihydropyrimidinase